ncbi:MAG: TonB-dependent receptor plug domain-containing protein [Caulobacterales bacterium]
MSNPMLPSRRHRFGGSLALLLCGAAWAPLAGPAFAQEPTLTPPPQTEEVPADEEAIVVIGSRIPGAAQDGAVQALTVTREQILESGAAETSDIFRDLTVTSGGAGTFSTSTAGALSSDTPVGSSAVSLRGLGASSTLTLVNGRRASVSAFALGQQSFIDTGSIPAAAIERVEVLPNGASALYGADAIAGVVNIVLREDFEGFEVSASYGDSTADTDEGRINLNAVWGGQFGGHQIMAVGDYFQRNALFDRDRAISQDSVRPSQQGFFPSFNDLFLMRLDQTEEPADGGCASPDFGTGSLGEFCEVDNNDFVSTNDALESYGGLLTHRYRFGGGLEWYNELIVQRTESRGTSSPANFSRAPIDPQNPNWPAALIADINAEARVTNFSSFFRFPIFAWGKFPEPRAVEVESTSFRFTSGLEFELDNGWEIDASLLYGGNDRTQRGLSGLVLSERFYDANLGNLCTDGSRVRRWDVTPSRPTARYFGETCESLGRTTLWYNPFSGQDQQAAGVDAAIRTTAERTGESRLWVADFAATGDLFSFNGRTVQAAFGAEWRREELNDAPAGEARATFRNPEPILGFSSTSAVGERDAYAAFAELYVPLSDTFEVQLAGRYDEYDGFGGDFNPKVAFRFAPNDAFIVRGNWSTSFRAPSIAEAGAGTLLSSYTVNCRITPQACNNSATASGRALLSEDVANPNLQPEEAESWGVGFLFRPHQDIDFSLDYWNIEHENLVGIDEDDFIRRALAGAFPVVAPGLLPTGSPGLEVDRGFVTDAHFQLTNLGFQRTSGLDASYTQYWETAEYGTFSLLADVTYLLEFDRKSSSSAAVESLAGTFRYPEVLADVRLRWRGDRWGASLAANYTSSYEDDPAPRTLAAVGLPADAIVEVDSWLVFDASVSFEVTPASTIRLNVQNLLDEEPPLVLGTSANVDNINHDSLGRFVSLRFSHSF